RSRARSHVPHSAQDFPPDLIQQPAVLKGLQEPEGIPATDKNGRVVRERMWPRPVFVNAFDLEPEVRERAANLAGISVPVSSRIRYEGDGRNAAKKSPDRAGAMVQVRPAVANRVTDQQKLLAKRWIGHRSSIRY